MFRFARDSFGHLLPKPPESLQPMPENRKRSSDNADDSGHRSKNPRLEMTSDTPRSSAMPGAFDPVNTDQAAAVIDTEGRPVPGEHADRNEASNSTTSPNRAQQARKLLATRSRHARKTTQPPTPLNEQLDEPVILDQQHEQVRPVRTPRSISDIHSNDKNSELSSRDQSHNNKPAVTQRGNSGQQNGLRRAFLRKEMQNEPKLRAASAAMSCPSPEGPQRGQVDTEADIFTRVPNSRIGRARNVGTLPSQGGGDKTIANAQSEVQTVVDENQDRIQTKRYTQPVTSKKQTEVE
ncbi:hypothetical protein K491DRAFT_720846 [Lophiostoma macrostomum CBS 122681]|uniref:Uncharacterized protein n=1 Tax=Lophiostoma macrostomum CBS 122681 TaxID=1314788 RepID=A0A6A6SUT4_9PLEO|nr:hypothetical protein K491DRAFT_720846 [Lophiostoma macrostomum CBS 122681]